MKRPGPPQWRKRSAAVFKRVHEGRPSTAGSNEADPGIVALVEEPFSSVSEVHDSLGALREAFAARDDDRAVFLSVYERTTGAVADRISRGEFENPDWVADYLVTFANLYREAVHDYEVGALDRLADPWQIAFQTADRSDSLVVQDALLGINAHVNYDLAFALDEVGIESDRSAKYADHTAVTDVLRRLVDGTQELLAEEYASGVETIDGALGDLDEWMAVFTLEECRDSAWRNAVAMNSRFRLRRWLARRITHATATGTAYLVVGSRASSAVHDSLQELEGSSGGV